MTRKSADVTTSPASRSRAATSTCVVDDCAANTHAPSSMARTINPIPAIAQEWLKGEEAQINLRYERELMNPREALSLGSISEIVMPADLRSVLGRNLESLLRSYVPGPMNGPQREFH